MEVEIKHPFSMMISGGRGAGKTVFTKENASIYSANNKIAFTFENLPEGAYHLLTDVEEKEQCACIMKFNLTIFACTRRTMFLLLLHLEISLSFQSRCNAVTESFSESCN